MCKGNVIFCHVDCFCLQEEKEDEREVFSVAYTEATASAMTACTYKLKKKVYTRALKETGFVETLQYHVTTTMAVISSIAHILIILVMEFYGHTLSAYCDCKTTVKHYLLDYPLDASERKELIDSIISDTIFPTKLK